jgi:hypothetical protein
MLPAFALATVYLVASIGKVADRVAVEEYVRPLVGRASPVLAATVVGFELSLGAGLIAVIVDPAVAALAGSASAAFVVAAAGFQAALLVRTESTYCRCLGRLSAATDRVDAAWQPAIFGARNGALAATSMVVSGAPLAGVLAAPAAVAIVLLVGLLESFRRQRYLLRTDLHPLRAVLAPTMATLQAHGWWVNGHPRRF